MSAGRTASPAGWVARPWAARLLRCALTVLPLLASVVFVWLLSRWLPAPSGSAFRYALWWLALSALGSVVLLIVDRAARRLLPLAALLRLSLVFPDAAPSRFRAPAFLALGSSTVTVTAVDNGGTANGGSDTSAPRSATITIIVG